MFKIRRGDTVRVIAGKDRGKQGKVIRVLTDSRKALVEGVNFVTKHRRRTQQEQHSGMIQVERPLYLSNLMVVCGSCNSAVRVKCVTAADETKSRVCKKCNEMIEEKKKR